MPNPVYLLIVVVALAAALVQRLTGFGSGLIPMAILPGSVGIRTVAPLVALLTPTVDLMMFSYLNPARFRVFVRVLLFGLGVRMMVRP